MVRFVPLKDSVSGRALASLGRFLGLRSETVYSRAILLTALLFLVLGTVVVSGVWYLMFRQFDLADTQEARASAVALRGLLADADASSEDAPPQMLLENAGQLLGREVSYRRAPAGEWPAEPDGIVVRKLPGGLVESFFRHGQTGVVVIAGRRPYYETGTDVARLVLVGLALAGGVALLLILFIVDRTILARVQLLLDRVDHEKQSERLPVKLDVPGDDEIAQLAGSIEELAQLVKAAEREYRNVVEDQIDSICRFDNSGSISFYNSSFEELCELPPRGRRPTLESCVAGDTLRTVRLHLEQLMPAKPVTSFTHVVINNGAPPVWYRSTLRANFDADGRRVGGQWIAADVTGEVEVQRRLQESQEQLQVLSGRLMNLQDQERRRIARDLHDSTAQALSALEINASLLESAATDEPSRKLAADTAAISRQVCQELRNISYLLHPPLLDEQGLAFAIRWFVDGFTKRNNIPVFLDLPEDFPRLRSDEETALFRIVQEALSNIYRHAGATKAWITLRRGEDGSVSLEVRDNGEGLPAGFSFTKSVGVGLAGMRERMKQLGGALDVDSSPYGVSVKCRMSEVTSDL
jgi:signal transduction histidine kinase